MARMLLLLTFALFTTHANADAPKPKPDAPAKVDGDAFPLPKDATPAEAAPGGGGKIWTHQVPRGRDVVIGEIRDLLKKGAWTITKDDSSPSGRAIRLEVKKGDKLIKASFTGDATRTAIILTLP